MAAPGVFAQLVLLDGQAAAHRGDDLELGADRTRQVEEDLVRLHVETQLAMGAGEGLDEAGVSRGPRDVRLSGHEVVEPPQLPSVHAGEKRRFGGALAGASLRPPETKGVGVGGGRG